MKGHKMSIETQAPTETKAQRAERLKQEKNPWESLAGVRALAAGGFCAVPEAWLKTYLRWWGIYTQGDGAGALGGSGGEGKAAPCFMLRIRLGNGFLRASQLRAIAGLTEKYAHGIADITVRQNIQLHWIRTEDLPDVMETLFSNGLTSQSTCGDVTRNITGGPLAGVHPPHTLHASPLALPPEQNQSG